MAKAKPSGGGLWYLVAQHDEFQVVQSETIPDLTVPKGERMKTVFGPFLDQQAAKDRADKLERRTLKWLAANS